MTQIKNNFYEDGWRHTDKSLPLGWSGHCRWALWLVGNHIFFPCAITWLLLLQLFFNYSYCTPICVITIHYHTITVRAKTVKLFNLTNFTKDIPRYKIVSQHILQNQNIQHSHCSTYSVDLWQLSQLNYSVWSWSCCTFMDFSWEAEILWLWWSNILLSQLAFALRHSK